MTPGKTMAQEIKPKILILYSSPGDMPRLRIDKEHRAVDQALQKAGFDPTLIRRMHAVSVDDLAEAVQDGGFEVVQFSGHGSEEGIFLENRQLAAPELVDASRLAAILRSASPGLRVLLLLSCFSSSTLGELASSAPFIITVSGSASDAACLEFVSIFYQSYLKSSSITGAFQSACNMVEYLGYGKKLDPVLSRRATIDGRDVALCAMAMGNEGLLVDLSQVEDQIARLDVPRERFLSLLSRKIRIHRWIFDQPSERTLLSLGPYFGEFSWQSIDDPIVCRRILRVKTETDERTCETWASLLVGYNDVSAKRYRRAPNPASPELEPSLKSALESLYRLFEGYLVEPKEAAILRRVTPEQFKLAKSLVQANLRQADVALSREELPQVVSYVEAALTALHDLVDALTEALTEPT
jgi:hypothetical protein